MTSIFEIADDLGPEKIIHLYDQRAGLQAIVVVDNTSIGPSVGGIRMAQDASLEECSRLARAMSLKNAAAGLPHGGGKSVLIADPLMPAREKESLVRAFAQAISQITDYIPGPDMGTDETCMAWIKDEIGRVVGLPRVLGGIPLDEIGATGHGVAEAAKVAQEFGAVDIMGAKVAIQGYGAVGRHTARFLSNEGAKIVAVADSGGAAFEPQGFDLSRLDAIKAKGLSVANYPGATIERKDAVILADCDILVPAARPDVISSANVAGIRAKMIIEGANIPTTVEAATELHSRGVLVIPDFIANAGGVICASVEYRGGTEIQAKTSIKEKIRQNTHEVLQKMHSENMLPRDAATALARERLDQAMALRRVY